MCSGYFRYAEGYAPAFPGAERFAGRILHPQQWPENVDVAGRRVVVIGSGATAVTLVPALAQSAAKVTMLQRSPTWMLSRPSEDALAKSLRRLLPGRAANAVMRWQRLLLGMYFFNLSRRNPARAKRLLLGGIRAWMGPEHALEPDFTPRYDPWRQRLCLVPDGDLFRALRSGRAAIATGEIETFTPTGVRLVGGEDLPAELIVTATGLTLRPRRRRDQRRRHPVDWPRTLNYKGAMFSDVPNLVSVFGYSNASWTLKSDLIAEYVCRLLRHMARSGMRQATPRNDDPEVAGAPWLDLSSGYVQRSLALFPKQGSKAPWRLYQNYARDLMSLRFGKVDDGVMTFSS
jgi:cation diffusion facilitator CzcD-associated flavoprotein CzcO